MSPAAWREIFGDVRDRAALDARYAALKGACCPLCFPGADYMASLRTAYDAGIAELTPKDYEVKVRDPYPMQSERTYPVTGTYQDALDFATRKHRRAKRYTRICLRGQPYTLHAIR